MATYLVQRTMSIDIESLRWGLQWYEKMEGTNRHPGYVCKQAI